MLCVSWRKNEINADKTGAWRSKNMPERILLWLSFIEYAHAHAHFFLSNKQYSPHWRRFTPGIQNARDNLAEFSASRKRTHFRTFQWSVSWIYRGSYLEGALPSMYRNGKSESTRKSHWEISVCIKRIQLPINYAAIVSLFMQNTYIGSRVFLVEVIETWLDDTGTGKLELANHLRNGFARIGILVVENF